MWMLGFHARATRWTTGLVGFALARLRATGAGAPRLPEKAFVGPPPFADTEAIWAIVADGGAVPAATHHSLVATT
jgi:hypothetical protein